MIKRGIEPVHPGVVLKGLYLKPMEISITQAANGLGVARKHFRSWLMGIWA